MFQILNLSTKIVCREQLHLKKVLSVASSKLYSTSQNDYVKFVEQSAKKLRIHEEIDLLPADLDWKYLLDPKNLQIINENVKNRKGNGDILALVVKFLLEFRNKTKSYKGFLYLSINILMISK